MAPIKILPSRLHLDDLPGHAHSISEDYKHITVSPEGYMMLGCPVIVLNDPELDRGDIKAGPPLTE